MIYEEQIDAKIVIKSLDDLKEYGEIMKKLGIKVNKKKLGEELGVDRRTVARYMKYGGKKKTRNKKSKLDDSYDVIYNTLYDTEEDDEDKKRTFYYKADLWRVLTENNLIPECSESNFRWYINSKPEFSSYFNGTKYDKKSGKPFARYETGPGEQAQLDWKESLKIYVKDHEEPLVINVLVLLLGYSRFRVYSLTLSKTQDILFHHLDRSFEIMGGVPNVLLTDNMKTVMDVSRTENSPGKVNEKFAQFAKDYGFKVQPCIAFCPRTKGKIEVQMKILDELRAYNGKLTLSELEKKVQEINNRENERFHKSYSMIPILGLKKEKDFLSPLPRQGIRSHYQIETKTLKVNNSSMINYKSNQYSVPLKYRKSSVLVQVYDSLIHIFDKKDHSLIALHEISEQHFNYNEEHYKEIIAATQPYLSKEEIDQAYKQAQSALKDKGKLNFGGK